MNNTANETRSRSRSHDPKIFPENPWITRKCAILRQLKPIGKMIYLTGAFRLHIDGDGLEAVMHFGEGA